MKSSQRLLLAIALALPLSLAGNVFAATATDHDHGASTQSLELNAGQKWTIDAPLRQGMSKIHASVTSALSTLHDGKLSDTQYDAFANDINDQFTYIVQNCKLEPQADAQLHIVLGNVMSGLDVARGKEQGQERELGVVKVAQTLNAYGDHFDHADWKKIDLAH
ncbi:hypothetical protein H0A66_06690 [Alcaligenaceae bacterium]|nr:hypothetical protein [Alcaligenaceae bacterium]